MLFQRYHCIEPSGAAFLNTFIERPWVQARLLYWLGAAANIDGWLYYATDLWRPVESRKPLPAENLLEDTVTGCYPPPPRHR